MNEIRAREDLNPIEGGDRYVTPAAAPTPTPKTPTSPTGASPERSVLAARRVLEDTVRRSLTREADRARKAAASVEALQAWSRSYYGGVSEVAALANHLEPAIGALAPSQDSMALAQSLAREMHADSLRDLAALARMGPADIRSAVQSLTDNWPRVRPGAIADALLARLAS